MSKYSEYLEAQEAAKEATKLRNDAHSKCSLKLDESSTLSIDHTGKLSMSLVISNYQHDIYMPYKWVLKLKDYLNDILSEPRGVPETPEPQVLHRTEPFNFAKSVEATEGNLEKGDIFRYHSKTDDFLMQFCLEEEEIFNPHCVHGSKEFWWKIYNYLKLTFEEPNV